MVAIETSGHKSFFLFLDKFEYILFLVVFEIQYLKF